MPPEPLAGTTLLEAVADAPRGIPLAGSVARRIEYQPGEALGAVDALFAFDAAYTARFGEGPRDIWSALGLQERRKARRAGARGLTEAIGRGELFAGQVAAAAHTLRRPRTPRGERLLHIATRPGCASAATRSGSTPKTPSGPTRSGAGPAAHSHGT